MSDLFNTLYLEPHDLSKELNCPWGDRSNKHLLQKDLSVEENLNAAMESFPILKKLVKKHKFSLQEVERCRKECNTFVFSEEHEISQLKEFFRHWVLFLF